MTERQHGRRHRPTGPALRPDVDRRLLTSLSPNLFYNPAGGNTSASACNSRDDWYAGAAQRIEASSNPDRSITSRPRSILPVCCPTSRNYRHHCYTKGTGNASALVDGGPDLAEPIARAVPMLSLEKDLGHGHGPGLDRRSGIRVHQDRRQRFEQHGRLLSRRRHHSRNHHRPIHLSPRDRTGRQFPRRGTNAQGLYWINCAGNKLVIERSRIKGTLLVLNPGSGSMIGAGPISWSPATPGYPALLVRRRHGRQRGFHDRGDKSRAERMRKTVSITIRPAQATKLWYGQRRIRHLSLGDPGPRARRGRRDVSEQFAGTRLDHRRRRRDGD